MQHEIQIELLKPTGRHITACPTLRRGFLLPALAFILIAMAASPAIHAVTPPPDGGYPNGNTAEGSDALFSLTDGFENAAIGTNALYYNTSGYLNAAVGAYAMITNSTGIENTALGAEAMFENTNGDCNTAVGWLALGFNSTGSQNTALGASALGGNSTGNNNIAIGNFAGFSLTGSNNVALANNGIRGESGVMRLGTEGTQTATYIAGIRTSPLAVAVGVGINSSGQLGIRASSVRFKEAVKPMDKASEAILSLQPVTFRYKKTLDPSGQPQFGLIAEQVAKIDPDLVVSEANGKPFSVRYEEVNAMLLNEFLKEHRKVEEQRNKIEKQDAKVQKLEVAVAHLEAALKAQAAQIQKVSGQLATQAPVPRVVAKK
jgi:hypothetical protein